MGSCEKCDDRASGRLDCDLTSERGKRQGGGGQPERGRERDRKVTREWARVREDEQDRRDRERGRVMPVKEMKMGQA